MARKFKAICLQYDDTTDPRYPRWIIGEGIIDRYTLTPEHLEILDTLCLTAYNEDDALEEAYQHAIAKSLSVYRIPLKGRMES